MTESATVTFSQTGVQPPVYVVTSLSEPPWETLEMHVDKAQTASANLIFTRRFDNVAEGDHQYKIRIGEGKWVVDESKDSATDEHGNRNNVLHVKDTSHVESQSTANTPSQQEKPNGPQESRKDSTIDSSDGVQLPGLPVPFVVVQKVADTEQPGYGDTEPRALTEDASKRTADAEPDFEMTKEDTPTSAEASTLSDRPRVIVEKTDDKPAYGDDFGDNATISQRVAHDMRAADAAPNMLVITPEGHEEPGTAEEQAAPLFRHESFQSEEQLPSTPPALDTIEEVSIHSSADHTSSEDVTNTPSDPEESQDEQLDHDPLLSHEADLENENFDELDHGPLLSHETGMNGDIHSSDEDVEEDALDAAPLLPHETGFSEYKYSGSATYSDYTDDNISEPRRYMHRDDDEDEGRGFEPDEAPTFTHEEAMGSDCDEVDDTPLLPHERDFAIPDSSSPEEYGGFTMREQPTFDYENSPARALFGGRGRPGIFRARSNSSNLPHKMPKTDEEDENLLDPYLERFPTRRELILDRVATIGLHLPEDEPMDDQVHSPVMSVLSQACSSVDLVPVKSYTSLASVPEADDSDEELHGDVDSLPSPMAMNFGPAVTAFARDPHTTPMPMENRQLGLAENQTSQGSIERTMQTSEADSVGEIDGVKDTIMTKLHETIATPNKIFNPITPPLTPDEPTTTTDKEESTQVSEPQLRQRQVLKENNSEATVAAQSPSQDQEDNSDRAVTSSSNQQLAQHNETFLQTFFRIVFGSMGRFLTACVGDRKRAGVTMFAVSVAAVAYYIYALA